MKSEPAAPCRNPSFVGLRCLRCERLYQVDDARIDSGLGCASCLEEGFPAGLYCVYTQESKLTIDANQPGMLRYAGKLPYLSFPTLAEGQTGLASLEKLAAKVGVGQLLVKNEGQNPTGSHKDRMSPVAVARALAAGYAKMIASSSGNAGASLAAYAARAGLKCRIIAEPNISDSWRNAIELTGSELQLVQGDQRWPLMQKLVQEEGWFPVTNFWQNPISSHPVGIDGYKTVAHEIAEQQRHSPPTVVVVPTCRGDLLLGLWRGFVEAQEAGMIGEIPRLVAVEPAARLELVLEGADYRSTFEVLPNAMTSIDGGTATYQSLKALQCSSGIAVSVTTDETRHARRELAEHGLYVEMSSAAALSGLYRLKQKGQVTRTDRVVLVATSHGYKEPPEVVVPTSVRSCN